jgi:hypothetical protein
MLEGVRRSGAGAGKIHRVQQLQVAVHAVAIGEPARPRA